MRRKLSPVEIISFIAAILTPVIFLLLTLNTLYREKAVSSPLTEPEKSSAAIRKTSETMRVRAKTDFVYPTDGTRNPFSLAMTDFPGRAVGDKPTTALPILTGVIWDENNPIAILMDSNQRSYTAGKNGQVMSFKVVDIHSGRVLLEKAGKEYELKLWEEDKELSNVFLK